MRGISASMQLLPMYMNSMSGRFAGIDVSRSGESFGETIDLSLRSHKGMNINAVWKGWESTPWPVMRYLRNPLTMRIRLTSAVHNKYGR